ncbi:hypothetical protein BDN72DRAFT_843636 [Pluteus cervinus]|uniref:Uncharacterized protein n=1 Tax=Pluteus cervinus TaxID=181527 RepID=A0ACD3AME6_9AGAR|nr:hypothetical protein BDN72DRAFT_843636 [Pluteus cervinus]
MVFTRSHSPISTAPIELLTEIFLLASVGDPTLFPRDKRLFLLRITWVSKHWRAVALNSANLLSTVQLRFDSMTSPVCIQSALPHPQDFLQAPDSQWGPGSVSKVWILGLFRPHDHIRPCQRPDLLLWFQLLRWTNWHNTFVRSSFLKWFGEEVAMSLPASSRKSCYCDASNSESANPICTRRMGG